VVTIIFAVGRALAELEVFLFATRRACAPAGSDFFRTSTAQCRSTAWQHPLLTFSAAHDEIRRCQRLPTSRSRRRLVALALFMGRSRSWCG
jgi:hypothetical protein